MIGFEVARLLVQYIALTRNSSAALLYDPTTGEAKYWVCGVAGDGIYLGTPGVNLQRAYGRMGKLTDKFILLSDPPTEACVGMAALTDVKFFIHCQKQNVFAYRPGNALGAPEGVSATGKQITYTQPTSDWIARCLDHLSKNQLPQFTVEFARVPEGDVMVAAAQHIVAGGEIEVDAYVPPPPPAADDRLTERGPEVHAFWMTVARRLIGLIHLGALRAGAKACGHNIGCILVDANNKILAWGVNTLNNNATYHAETKCMWMYQFHHPGEKVPAGSILYTTLQSCLMCSATIKRACGDNDVTVIYADADKVKHSALTREGGAHEMPLSKALAEHRHLETGQHLLAAARWDRLKRAVHQRIDLAASSSASVVPGPIRARQIAEFMLTMSRTREDVEAEYETLKKAPLPVFFQRALDQVTEHTTGLFKERGVDGKFTGAAIGQFRQGMAAMVKGPALKVLEEERDARLAIERRANDLPYSGGAPMLLRNPILTERFYQTSEIRREVPADTSLVAAINWNRKRILDLTTQLHATDLLINVLARSDDYNLH